MVNLLPRVFISFQITPLYFWKRLETSDLIRCDRSAINWRHFSQPLFWSHRKIQLINMTLSWTLLLKFALLPLGCQANPKIAQILKEVIKPLYSQYFCKVLLFMHLFLQAFALPTAVVILTQLSRIAQQHLPDSTSNSPKFSRRQPLAYALSPQVFNKLLLFSNYLLKSWPSHLLTNFQQKLIHCAWLQFYV